MAGLHRYAIGRFQSTQSGLLKSLQLSKPSHVRNREARRVYKIKTGKSAEGEVYSANQRDIMSGITSYSKDKMCRSHTCILLHKLHVYNLATL